LNLQTLLIDGKKVSTRSATTAQKLGTKQNQKQRYKHNNKNRKEKGTTKQKRP
jgi:hypothetical protein